MRATVTALNQEHLLETAELHKAMGGRSTAIIPVNPVNSDESILPETLLPAPEKVIQGATDVFTSNVWKQEEIFPFNQYARRLMQGSVTKLGCGAPYGNIAVVAANGDVYPCIYLVGIKRFHIGNMMDGSYPRTEVLQRMYDDLHVDHREDCKGCAWRYKCGGGCPLGRLTVLNNPAASLAVKTYCKKICCDYTRSILETLLWKKAQEAATSQVEDPVRVPSCV